MAYVPFGRPVRGGNNNLEYYVNGVRVTKTQYSNWLSQLYNTPPTRAIDERVRLAKALMSQHRCMSWSFPDGSVVKY